MPAFEVLITVNAGDSPCRVVVFAANQRAAKQIAINNWVARETDHKITIGKLNGAAASSADHPDGTVLIGFDYAPPE
jgi:hypothetical protein